MSTQLNNDLESALGTIQAIQDIRAKYNIGNLNHSLAIPYALQVLNEFYSNDPVTYKNGNIAHSDDGLVFNIEVAINNRVLFIGKVIDPDLNTRPFPKMFDFSVFVDLNDQRLPRSILMIEWEELPDYLSWDSRGGSWKTYLSQQLRDNAIELYPRRGFRSVLDSYSHYDTNQGLFLPAF